MKKGREMRPYPRFGANDGNRTHNRSLGSCCFTTKLHSHYSRSLCPGRRDPPLQRLFYHKRAKGQPFLRKLPRRDTIRELIGARQYPTSHIPCQQGTGQPARKLFGACLDTTGVFSERGGATGADRVSAERSSQSTQPRARCSPFGRDKVRSRAPAVRPSGGAHGGKWHNLPRLPPWQRCRSYASAEGAPYGCSGFTYSKFPGAPTKYRSEAPTSEDTFWGKARRRGLLYFRV